MMNKIIKNKKNNKKESVIINQILILITNLL